MRDLVWWILRYHVDDLMLAGDESDPLYFSAQETIRGRFGWSSWEADTFEMCGCRVLQKRDGSIEVHQTVYARAIQRIPITAHRRRHQHEVISRHEHQQVITKRGELGWMAQQTMIALMAPPSLIVASEHATDKTLTELNSLVRLAHTHWPRTNFISERWGNPCLSLSVMLHGQTDVI